MTDFQQEFDTDTTTLNSIITTGLSANSQWNNIPGGLVKTSASSAGFVWGYNASNNLYMCALPCSGNWSEIVIPDTTPVADLTTDNTSVYVLTASKLWMNDAQNNGTWTPINITQPLTQIFSTHTYIWGQSGTAKQKCPKPCVTSNWIPVTENVVKITSSTDTMLYGVDGQGNGMQTDELMQSAWSPIDKVTGVSQIFADSDTIFAVDNAQKVLRYDPGEPEPQPVDTGGYTPQNIESRMGTMWMTTTTSGSLGNIFSKSPPNYSSIMDNLNPLEQQRKKVVEDVTSEYNNQTMLMTVNKQIDDVVNFFSKIFNKSGDTSKSQHTTQKKLDSDIQNTQKMIDQMNYSLPTLIACLVVIMIVALTYVFGSGLGVFVHFLALIELLAGLGYIMWNYKTNF